MSPYVKTLMDKTAYCRDKCASSANMISCMNDCQARPMAAAGPVSPFAARSPKLFGEMTGDSKKKMIIGSIVAIVAVGAGVWYLKKRGGKL
jgi:hypothetical protein